MSTLRGPGGTGPSTFKVTILWPWNIKYLPLRIHRARCYVLKRAA